MNFAKMGNNFSMLKNKNLTSNKKKFQPFTEYMK